MCRLVAYFGVPASPAPLVFGGSHSLHKQSYRPLELGTGSVNADGYGVVWYHEGRPARVASPFPIWRDVDLEGVLTTVSSGIIVAALRNTTPGIPQSETAIPPVVVDEWTFVLNGYVEGFRDRFMRPIHERIPDDLYGKLTGASDTEALALLAVAAGRGGATPGAALLEVVRTITTLVRREDALANLTMVLTDGRQLAACRFSTHEAINSLYVLEAPAQAPHGITLASEPLDPDIGWTAVEPQSVVTLDSAGIEVAPI